MTGWIERGWIDRDGNHWVTTADGARNLGPRRPPTAPRQPMWRRWKVWLLPGVVMAPVGVVLGLLLIRWFGL